MNHLSAIGFPVSNTEDFNKLVQDMTQREASVWDSPDGQGGYARVFDESSGAELWFYLDENQNITSLNPHYHGDAKLKAKSLKRIDSSGNPLEGLLSCWAVPRNDNDIEYPFVVNSPDFQLNKIEEEDEYDLQIAAFPHSIDCYTSKEDFTNSQTQEHKLATRSFIPVGTFSDDFKDDRLPPEPMAQFSGLIKNIQEKINAYTKEKFLVIKVDTLCGEIEVVLSPAWLNSKPKTDGILSGTFWLSAKIWG